MATPVTVIIHAYSYPETEECLRSAKLLSDSIAVIAMDADPEIERAAKQYGADYLLIENPGIVEPVRGLGIAQGKRDWVFLLDLDERITPELATEIKKTVENKEYSHYRVPRKEIFAKRVWLKNGGWYPNHQIRLIRKKDFVSWPARIHSTPEINGRGGFLTSPLLHYSQNDIAGLVPKTVIFEDRESDLLHRANRPSGTLVFFRKFLGELFRRLVAKQGYRDGTAGWIESIYQAFSKTITYLFLYEKSRSV